MPDLPTRLGLCPDHANEFWYPLTNGEDTRCPCCSLAMTVYMSVAEHERLRELAEFLVSVIEHGNVVLPEHKIVFQLRETLGSDGAD